MKKLLKRLNPFGLISLLIFFPTSIGAQNNFLRNIPLTEPFSPVQHKNEESKKLNQFQWGERLPENLVNIAFSEIDRVVRQLMNEQKIVGLALGIVKNKEIIFLKGYGYADLESRIPVDPNHTLFRWASLSKAVTAIITAQLVRANIVNWDSPIETWFTSYQMPKSYLVECRVDSETYLMSGYLFPCEQGYAEVPLPLSTPSINLHQLLGHIAGIMGYESARGRAEPDTFYFKSKQNNSILRRGLQNLLDKPLLSIPGSQYLYTTFGYNLAGVVLEEASGQSYPQLLQTYVTNRANLKTLQPDYEWKKIPNRAQGYRLEKGQIIRESSTDVSWKMAGGGLISTPRDLANFCGALMDDTLINETEKKRLWREQITTMGNSTKYGLGFFISQSQGRFNVSHHGLQEKTKARFILYPDENLCFVIMSNTNSAKLNTFFNALTQIN